MFDITAINQPFGTFAMAKNADGEFDYLDKNGKWTKTKGTLVGRDPSKDANVIKVTYRDEGFIMIRTLKNGNMDSFRKIRLDTLSDRYNWEKI